MQHDRKQIASDIGENPGRGGGQTDMGALSGRDDSAGGCNDRMERENTGERTDHWQPAVSSVLLLALVVYVATAFV